MPPPQLHAWYGKPWEIVARHCGQKKRSSRAVDVPGRCTATALWVRQRWRIGSRAAPHVWYATNCICARVRPPQGQPSSRERVIVPQVLQRHCCGKGSTSTPRSMFSLTMSTAALARSSAVSPSSFPVAAHGAMAPMRADRTVSWSSAVWTGSTQLATRQMRPSRSAVWPGRSPKRICDAPRSTFTTGHPESRREPVPRRPAGTASACPWGRGLRPTGRCWPGR